MIHLSSGLASEIAHQIRRSMSQSRYGGPGKLEHFCELCGAIVPANCGLTHPELVKEHTGNCPGLRYLKALEPK